MLKKYDKADLMSVSLFDLRNIAKEVGVKSPTIYNKRELIEKILETARTTKVKQEKAIKKQLKNSSSVAEKIAKKETEENLKKDIEDNSNKDTNVEFFEEPVEEHRYVDEPFNNSPNVLCENEPDYDAFFGFKNDRRSGYLELICNNNNVPEYGFLRAQAFENSSDDSYIHINRIKKYGLRKGDFVEATVSKKIQENKPAPVVTVEKINGIDAELVQHRPYFDDLVPVFPDKKIVLETADNEKDFAIRCIDLIAPIGKGQRALIVSPPKAGKTTLLKKIASSISKNYPDIDLEVVLIDERPEEVTDMIRTINGNVWYSTFDEQPEHHIKVVEFLLDKAKRLVEMGKDVVILMDSLTRLARANNMVVNPTGRTLSGGIDPSALYFPKKFFGSARNIENGGSLTIIATALVDTGSRMDDVIFEEFKGTGNMEIRLDRALSEKRIFPAINLNQSSTRREDLLLSSKELKAMYIMRKILSDGEPLEAMEKLLNTMSNTKDNDQFVKLLTSQKELMEKDGFNFL